MVKTKRKAGRALGDSELRRHHRARILLTVLAICRNIERLQISAEARRACREIAELLNAALSRELPAPASPRTAGIAECRPPPPMPCILVIDDNQSVLEALDFYLRSIGYAVLLAGGGELGLRLAGEHPVDIVMLDIEMPQMSGMAVCQALKANPALARIPVVMMTGRPTRDLVGRAQAAGASLVMGKPFDLDSLRATLERLLAPPAAVPAAGPEVSIGGSAAE